MKSFNAIPIATILFFSILQGPAFCADTLENFEPGFSDVEFYAGTSGLGQKHSEVVRSGEVLLGVGLHEKLSGYFGAAFEADAHLAGAAAGLNLGLFSTLHDGEHIDFDLLLDLGMAGSASDMMNVMVGGELNYDESSGQSNWGVFLNLSAAWRNAGADEGVVSERIAMDLPMLIGAYRGLGSGGQLFATFDMILFDLGQANMENQAHIALGFNQPLAGNLELITEYALCLHEEGSRDWRAHHHGLTIGLISTLP